MSRILTWIVATHAGILTSQLSTLAHAWGFNPLRTFSYRLQRYAVIPQLRYLTLAPFIFGAGTLDQ